MEAVFSFFTVGFYPFAWNWIKKKTNFNRHGLVWQMFWNVCLSLIYVLILLLIVIIVSPYYTANTFSRSTC